MYSFVPVFDVPIIAGSMDDVVKMFAGWIEHHERKYVCTLDVHALMESQSNPDIRRIYSDAALVTPDGMPLVWLLRRQGYSWANRICGPDLMPKILEYSAGRSIRHFFYGSTEDTLARLAERVRQKWPHTQIAGCLSPPFRPLSASEAERIDDAINGARPDIVWVGLGAPKQDRWMAEHRLKLDAPVLVGVGAAFDMMAGVVRRAPPWLRRTGCEWMYRLSQEPGRLWRRYLKANSQFVFMVLKSEMRLAGEMSSNASEHN
jgi:N-acetylglucosaminyldiphosphoundecaprenol N-acetyl-beta-D-mannosaminyltransferase